MRKEKSKSGKVKVRNKALFIGIIGIVAIVLAVAAIGATANNNTEASDKVNAPDVPHKINYQGYLTDADGNPITGDRDMTFRIYDSPTEGTPLWSETQTSVHVENGLFNVILGSVNPIPGDVFPSGGSRWLETEIEGQTLTPRKEIVSVAYALKADKDNDWCDVGSGWMHPCNPDNVFIKTEGAESVIKLYGDNYQTGIFGTRMGTGAGLRFFTQSDATFNERMRITNDGKVGIGTTDPQGLFQVGGGTFIVTPQNWVGINDLDPDAKLEVSVDGQITPDLFMLSSNDNEDGDRFIVKNDGKVGIGTTFPLAKLDVRGGSYGATQQIVRISGLHTASLSSNRINYGIYAETIQHNPSSNSPGTFVGANFGAYTPTICSANIGTLGGVNARARHAGTGTADDVYGLDVWTSVASGGNIGNAYGIKEAVSTDAGGNIANGYGVYIDDNTGNIGNSYGLYQAGSDDTNYFAGNVGIRTASPHTKLHVAGPIATAVRNVAISSTVTQEDSIVVVTGTATGITITLPSAVGLKGRQYTIKNMNHPNPVTVATTGWERIDSNPTYLLQGLLLGGIGKSITVVSDGTDWLIIAEIK